MSRPAISVCIPTRGDLASIEDCVWSLLCQTAAADSYELLVVAYDGTSTDALRTWVNALAARGYAIASFATEGDVCAARTRALEAGRGDYLYLIDPEVTANARLVEHLCEAIEAHHPDWLTGHIHPSFDVMPPATLEVDHWRLWGLRHYGAEPRWLDGHACKGDGPSPGNVCIARPIAERLLRESDLADALRAPSLRGRIVPEAYVFLRVPESRFEQTEVLRNIAADARAASSFDSGLWSAWGRQLVWSWKRLCLRVLFRLEATDRRSTASPTQPARSGAEGSESVSPPPSANPLLRDLRLLVRRLRHRLIVHHAASASPRRPSLR